MADEAQKPTVKNRIEDEALVGTRLFDPGESLSRQEEDIALAAELLHVGIVNERDLTAAVSDWSMHGVVPLAQHLLDCGLLNSTQMDALQSGAALRVERARRSAAGGSEVNAPGDSMLLATLERLDGSGRVAKLFGVTVATRKGGQDARVLEGRYELIRKLGQGGLGRVWLARDLNLKRNVALKEISHVSHATESMSQRFRHEAEITGRLEHPSIVPVYQLGEDLATGRMFYAMRFLGRTTLQDSISEYHERRAEGDHDCMLLRNLLTSFVNVCHAIGHAHSRKVIHRDLKPENVVIDSFGQVIVIDWGLAKVLDDTAAECLSDSAEWSNTAQTSEGQVLGTPLYMAPEQAAGRLDELDHRTDIYGLGATLFAIVTGYAPHEKTQRESIDSGVGARGMISVIAKGETPSARDNNPDVDPVLEAICRKAMARRRYARYQSACALAEDVQRWMAGEPVTAYQESTWQRLNRWVSQHRRISQAAVAAAMVVVAAVTTLAMSAWQNRLAIQRSRFAQMEGDIREVELQLQGVVLELAKDARFIASLPPIQGIVNARSGVKGDDETVWRGRLETVFEGMLRSNPDYLALAFEANQDGVVSDIARVERNPADPTLVRVLPSSRLRKVKTDKLMDAAVALEPGDVKMSLEPRSRHVTGSSSSDRLSVATPVYSDMSGAGFGMTVIETDLSNRIREVLLGLGVVDCEIFVADGLGQLWASVDPMNGVRDARPGEAIPDLPADVAKAIEEPGRPIEMRRDQQYLVQRFYLDPEGRGVTLFARLPADDQQTYAR